MVAPRVGAWIETIFHQLELLRFLTSHPVWVRGLKRRNENIIVDSRVSHPVWVRGLKQAKHVGKVERGDVAPRVGAWIETLPLSAKPL